MISLFHSFPQPVKNLATSLIAAWKKKKKYGTEYQLCFDFLCSSTPEQQINQAFQELEQFLTRIKNSNRFYTIPKSLDILEMETLEKQIVIENYNTILQSKPYMTVHSSGTTGQRLAVPHSRKDYQREYAFWWYHRNLGGVDRDDRIATIAGHKVTNVNQDTPPFWVYNYAESQLFFSSYHLSPKNIAYYIQELNKFQPALIHGYPSSIYLIAKFVLEENVQLTFKPKMVISASESTLDFQKITVEKAFQCKNFIFYGNTEYCGHIAECTAGKLHVQPYHSYLRILNDEGKDVEPGEQGCIVATNFANDIFPLINYNTKDVAQISREQNCTCGQKGLIVDYILGRIEDYIITPEGRQVGRLDHLFKNAKYVRNAQIEQNSKDQLIVRIQKQPGYTQAVEQTILKEARSRLGNQMQISFDYVNEIPREKNGKFKFILQNTNHSIRSPKYIK